MLQRNQWQRVYHSEVAWRWLFHIQRGNQFCGR